MNKRQVIHLQVYTNPYRQAWDNVQHKLRTAINGQSIVMTYFKVDVDHSIRGVTTIVHNLLENGHNTTS